MKVLSLSDRVIDFIYTEKVKERFADIDLILGCGDLPYYYLEYILTQLEAPLFFVRGNHEKKIEYSASLNRTQPLGAIDLHTRGRNYKGVLLAGVEGSVRYNSGPFQYTQTEMWGNVFSLLPNLFFNRIKYGRYLDVFISHASPWQIHDKPDRAHLGAKAFAWLIKVFQPRYHFHGHIHVYRSDEITQTSIGKTKVINTYGYKETILDLDI